METDDKNVILSFSSDRLSGDIYMVKLKGSTVVEMAYLMPVVLLCWMAVIFALFITMIKILSVGRHMRLRLSEVKNGDGKRNRRWKNGAVFSEKN